MWKGRFYSVQLRVCGGVLGSGDVFRCGKLLKRIISTEQMYGIFLGRLAIAIRGEYCF